MKYVTLTKGMRTKVDDEDYEELIKFRWCYNACAPGYAIRGTWVEGKFKQVSMHRFLMGNPKGMTVDHINNDSLDNQKSNLRICTFRQNCHNSKKMTSSKATSKYKGVHKETGMNKWVSGITINGKYFVIGRYSTELEAAIAYNEMAVLHRGKYAWLNTIDK